MADKIYDIVTVTLGASVAIGGTFNASYPGGKGQFDYLGGDSHLIISSSAAALFAKDGDFSISFGVSNMTVTIRRGRGFTAGDIIKLNLDRAALGLGEEVVMADPEKMTVSTLVRVNLGKPIASSANAIVLSQAATSASGLATGINGATAQNGAAVLDVPRAIVAAWTGTAVVTVFGTDEYGNVVSEASASGTTFAGKKAFKAITRVTTSANITGLTVGTGKVLGLPFFLASAASVMRELEDSAVPTSGALVAGVSQAATATTGDVRGTYAPNSNPDGSKVFELLVATRNPEYTGAAQFAG